MVDENKYYVYLHAKPCGTIFYVGKGCGDRAHSTRHRNERWHRTVRKYGYNCTIAEHGLSEDCALKLEVDLIARYKSKDLCNMTLGGDGVSGHKHSQASRDKMRAAQTGSKKSEETRAKISASAKGIPKPHFWGVPLADEHKKAISESLKGRKNPRYNATPHNFKHEDGSVFFGTQRDIIERFNLHHGAISGMVRGKVKSVKGWTIEHS